MMSRMYDLSNLPITHIVYANGQEIYEVNGHKVDKKTFKRELKAYRAKAKRGDGDVRGNTFADDLVVETKNLAGQSHYGTFANDLNLISKVQAGAVLVPDFFTMCPKEYDDVWSIPADFLMAHAIPLLGDNFYYCTCYGDLCAYELPVYSGTNGHSFNFDTMTWSKI